jgi:hypothetical protein
MQPPAKDDVATSGAADLLEEIHLAVRAGRLVGLLKGRGLNRSTIDELLRPESALALKAILTDHLYPEEDHRTRATRRNNEEEGDPGHTRAEGPHRGGKVLVYQRKEGCKT